MSSSSLWKIISHAASYPQLQETIEVDVCIIGGGITGITAAAVLIEHGKKVAIVDANQIGGTTTSMSTGNLYIPVQPFFQTVAKNFNEEIAIQVADGRKHAIDYIEENVHSKNIKCNFSRRPWYAFTRGKHVELLEREYRQFEKMNVPVEYTNDIPFPMDYTKAMMVPNQARFNPLQYVLSMAEYLVKQGCLIFENSHVTEFSEEDSCVTITQQGKVISRSIFMATHTPVGVNFKQIFLAPYRSYVVAAQLDQLPEGHLWDLDTSLVVSTHSLKESAPQVLMISGNHHKTGQGVDMVESYAKLESYIQKFPHANPTYRWSAQHFQSADSLPYIGLASKTSKHTYMATGYFADGLTYGTLAGILIAEQIVQKDSPQKQIFVSTRINPAHSLPFVAEENLNVLGQYAKDLPLFTSDNFDDIQNGEGKVVQINREKWAVCRHENSVHVVSAVCPHMKCIVNWNNAEKTWDCPCHGSRFSPEGKFLEGPALCDLESFKK